MKEVREQVETVSVSQVDQSKYYGVERFQQECRGFVTRGDYNVGSFILAATESVTNGNGWTQYRDEDLGRMIRFIIKRRKVYEFDTAKELFKWLSE